MAVTHRPTFSESWYRVSELSPRLLGAVTVHRQYFRGRKWYVLQDPANNSFSRLSDAAYHFVAMLDGRRTVNTAWNVCMERFQDAAPTQSEAINVLSQLYLANLLHGNLAPDARELFERYRRRTRRELSGFLTNFLFIRFPLWDPDRFLDRWTGLIGRFFTGYGLALWCVVVGLGLWTVGENTGLLTRQVSGVLDPKNLPLLYLSLVVAKVIHELGHAFSCKAFGRREGTGGEVHQIGVTLLVFTPLPFVDASSAWALKNKWHRAIVGASGMLAELAVAAVAAVIWSRTAEGTTVHGIAYNMMFIASVSTLLFNGNPFLRYDAYYILLDLVEIPNLDSRSKAYLQYLVKRYLFGVKMAHDPSHTRGERGWLVFYGVVSTVVRIAVFSAIIVFVGSKLFAVGILVAVLIAGVWVVRPLVRLCRYLAISPELGRVRSRAVWVTLAVVAAIAGPVGLIRAPDRFRVEGVVEPFDLAVVHMQRDGFVEGFLDSGGTVTALGAPLIRGSSPLLVKQRDRLGHELQLLQTQRQLAQTREPAAAQIIEEKIEALEDQIRRNRQDVEALDVRPPIAGTWVAPDIDRMKGMYLKQGRKIGMVADLTRLRIRAVAGQAFAGRLINESLPVVQMRVKGRPETTLTGRVETVIPAGYEDLPSAALGYAAGGSTRVDLEDPSGLRAAEPFFEILVVPIEDADRVMRPGQTMILRFETRPKPLAQQGWRSLLQLFQRKFRV